MKKILVPIDLSESSDNAIKIAQKLSNNITEIVIISIISAPSEATLKEDGTMKENDDLDVSTYQVEANKTELLILEKYNYLTNSKIMVKIGDINNIIMSEVKTGIYDLLVLGVTGQLAASFWSNKHTEYLSKHVKIPILTLKCDRANMTLDKILFVSDFIESEKINLSIIKKIAENFNSKIVLLKILTKDQQIAESVILAKANEFAHNNELSNFETALFYSRNIEEGIANFTEENHIDLICIGTHQRRGFSTLFRKSVSQDLVKTLYHPIITIPIEEA